MSATGLPECLTTIKHLHIIADRYERPVVQLGDYFYVVVEKPGRDPMAYVAPVAGVAGLVSDDLLTYETPITDGVLGWLDEAEVAETLDAIAALPNWERS